MQMNTGFDGSMIEQLLETAEEKKEKDKKEEEDEMEIERKYYQKPDISVAPLQGADFLQAYVQGMM